MLEDDDVLDEVLDVLDVGGDVELEVDDDVVLLFEVVVLLDDADVDDGVDVDVVDELEVVEVDVVDGGGCVVVVVPDAVTVSVAVLGGPARTTSVTRTRARSCIMASSCAWMS